MVFIKPYPENGNPDFVLAFLQTLIFMVTFILGINILKNFKMYNWHNSKVRKKSATGEDLCLKGVGIIGELIPDYRITQGVQQGRFL